MKRVVVTGMAGFSPVGNDWPSIRARLESQDAIGDAMDWKKATETDIKRIGTHGLEFL